MATNIRRKPKYKTINSKRSQIPAIVRIAQQAHRKRAEQVPIIRLGKDALPKFKIDVRQGTARAIRLNEKTKNKSSVKAKPRKPWWKFW